MIVGVGIDLVEVARFAAVLGRTPGVARRLFTVDELAVGTAERLAARFAAKEAVVKALAAPPGLRWHDCEVRREPGGRPLLVVRGTVAAAADRVGVRHWHVSLTHSGGMAAAMVVAES